jgi:hypothetical protein
MVMWAPRELDHQELQYRKPCTDRTNKKYAAIVHRKSEVPQTKLNAEERLGFGLASTAGTTAGVVSVAAAGVVTAGGCTGNGAVRGSYGGRSSSWPCSSAGAGIAVASTSTLGASAVVSGVGVGFFSLGLTIVTRIAVKMAEMAEKKTQRKSKSPSSVTELKKRACRWQVSLSSSGCVVLATLIKMVTFAMVQDARHLVLFRMAT